MLVGGFGLLCCLMQIKSLVHAIQNKSGTRKYPPAYFIINVIAISSWFYLLTLMVKENGSRHLALWQQALGTIGVWLFVAQQHFDKKWRCPPRK